MALWHSTENLELSPHHANTHPRCTDICSASVWCAKGRAYDQPYLRGQIISLLALPSLRHFERSPPPHPHFHMKTTLWDLSTKSEVERWSTHSDVENGGCSEVTFRHEFDESRGKGKVAAYSPLYFIPFLYLSVRASLTRTLFCRLNSHCSPFPPTL